MNDIYKSPDANLQKEDENTSGMGKGHPMPDSVKGWSWGAFLFNWLWAIFNKSWIGLLAFVPYIGFIMSIVLGVKGREWAWQNKRWESVEHFNRVQRKWSVWGLSAVAVGILAAIAIPAYNGYIEAARAAAG